MKISDFFRTDPYKLKFRVDPDAFETLSNQKMTTGSVFKNVFRVDPDTFKMESKPERMMRCVYLKRFVE